MDKAELGLYELLIERLLADDAVDDATSGLILAAWSGDDALADALAGRGAPTAEPPSETEAEHPDVYLAAVHAEGFRGIGRPATLQLAPGPGLTLVTGRNGSGKSSFAEAAELVMTGRNERWSGRTAVWRDGWRNLHSGDDASVAVDLTVAGTNGTTKVQRRWAPEDKLEGGRWTRQEPKAKVQDFDGSVWGASMQTYRPFLSYSELGALIDGKPTELHDAVHDLLGLGALTATQTRLKAARKPLADRARDANAERKAIRTDLASADDPRIVEALALLKSTSPDLGRLAGLLTAAEDPGGSAASLRAVLDLRLPAAEDVRATAERIRAAVDEHTAVASAESSRADVVARLLREALHVHTDYGSTTCPLCEQGTLDDAWRASAATRADQLERSAAEVRGATSELEAAIAAGRSLVHALPAVLTGRARETWQDWVQAGRAEGPAALVQGLEAAHPVVAAALAEARAESEAELARRDEVWAPVVRRLGAYHDVAAEVAVEASANATLARAEKWLADTATELRSQRLAPFAEQSQHVWQALRQQSNVGLGAVRLTGTHNQRRVAVDVSIDGVDGGAALGVMSQGELHSLGLALFLPRATVDQSPFRFIVIDDPVQAMDPAKVDGLARVLAEVALTRQVVVFTHDDRLADAVRRLELPATIWEVVRGEQSAVEMRRSDDPIARYLDDAKAMASTEDLPPDIRSELVASCCRSAVEAACHSKIRSVRLAAGHTHADVEVVLKNADTTNKKATLAVFDDPTRGSDLLGRIKSGLGPGAVDAFQKCKKGAHKGLVGDLHPFIKDVKKLAEWLQK
ncbi:AAA family ATPase [Pseudonocardia oroxyli]|uniref:Nuclease SbcCD subunit C n=1 Tax=Pseudonocardia oroxyli TaxID=366584 RepID=A0A1G7ZTX7_PSEOR|nr:AAA family ATPase [Pseudonocardia oroxyli]SDH11610.1 AAA domain-containing protein [Pseudonocardia oroxyli]